MEHLLKKPVVVCILALISCLLWGSAFPCVKIGYEWFRIQDVGSIILFAGYRFFLAGIITFLVACILEKRVITIKRSAIIYVIGLGLLQTTVQYVFFYIGMANTTGVKGSVINAANVFVSIIAAHFLIKAERMTLQKALGCLLGFAGVVIINLSPGAWGMSFKLSGEGMIVICTILYGISSVFMKLISHRGTPMALTAYQLLFGGGLLIIIGFCGGGQINSSQFSLKSTLLLVYLAALAAAAFSLWNSLLKYNPVGKVTIYGFSIPIFGSILSAVLLGEDIISIKNFIALILVSIGIIIVNRTSVNKGNQTKISP